MIVISLATVALAASISVAFARDDGAQAAVKMGEWGLRSHADAAPMPEYPRTSIEKKVTGVVVAEVRFGIDGRLEMVNILEAPAPEVATAVRQALGKWRIPATEVLGRGEKYATRGKLTFYFQVSDGKGRVLNPDQMLGGVSPRKRSGPPTGSSSAAGTPPRSAPVVVHGHGEMLKSITVEELKAQAPGSTVVLDIGDRDAFKRGHWPAAVNIPYDEVEVRGGPELQREKLIVIDCTQSELPHCQGAGTTLTEQGFSKVALLVR